MNETLVVFAGNKADDVEHSQITLKDGTWFAEEFGCWYFETSAKENTGINELFDFVATDISKRINDEIKMTHQLR